MRFKKFAMLILLAVSFGLFFNACEETTSTTDGPVIDAITPATGVAGDIITITGSAFGEYDQATCKVYFNGELASIKADGTDILWADDEIQAIVPTRATTGPVTVVVGDNTSNGFTFTVPAASPATGLKATSISDTEVALMWTLSTDENLASFQGYWLYVYPEGGSAGTPISIPKATNKYTVPELDEGVIYNFDLHAVIDYNGTNMLSPKATVKWSPAVRFTMNINSDIIKLYESDATTGSGLALYDATGKAPKTLTVTNGANWDLGLYTDGGVLQFGFAKNILAKYTKFTGTAKKCEMGSEYYDVASLNDVYDSQALSTKSFSEKFFDLATIGTTNNAVFIVRTNAPSWNYAKVMVLNNGGFLKGTSPNRYIEVVVSYQSVQGVPYAF